MNQRLELNFIKTDGASARISLPNPDLDKEPAEVKEAMDNIIASDVFAPGGAALAVAESARIVTTQITNLDFEG
ncbi:MAG: DUF2922 domain-containing protein [Tindallia sp. MSAO_Bac2]|nr:MAG: DUF2922 domain-containing protein [Tindallia sp. MSAO_Bac2]